MKKKGFFTPHSKIKVTSSRGVLIPMIQFLYTVKPVNVVTSVKQSPEFKGRLFLVLSWKISYELNLF